MQVFLKERKSNNAGARHHKTKYLENESRAGIVLKWIKTQSVSPIL